MKNDLSKKWINNLEVLDIAFQPILNIHTGKLFAVEALLRNHEEAGFKSIFSLFDRAYKDGMLYSFDIRLRKKALRKFTEISDYEGIKLFYNLDNRLLEMPNFGQGNTSKLLNLYGIDKHSICFEISERHEIPNSSNMEAILAHYRSEKYCIAIDDFGVGYSGYKLLYDSKPDIIKIDRFFLADINKDVKKKLMARSITHLAIQLGIKVIAEGIETKEELLACRDIGCHFVQGYLVQKPTVNAESIFVEYPHISKILKSERRSTNSDCKIEANLDKKEPFFIDTDLNIIVEYFQKNPEIVVVPVVNSNNEPIGILQESKIKELVYSPYGRSLMLNSSIKKSKLKNIIQPCGITEINCNISTIIELFSNNPESVGIVLTKNSKYFGFLSARAIITIMNEQNLIYAVEQNPLTKLPGNSMIEKYISEVNTSSNPYILCYFDLDNFKAFNDVYGFRNGDRAIQLFADILRKNLSQEFFKAHIGGDDFFVAIECKEDTQEQYISDISEIIRKFADDARGLYSKEDKIAGYLVKNILVLSIEMYQACVLVLSKN
ncbi:GGDEF domain-containing protein [Sulfurimonas sp.]|uniref:GGDEF domain-containing protein n=1 Tax=Sulfurimonas sp. TaxID=2022749 RepID=UPI0025DD2EE0|nr:GGDEF domain-containing protein [Sulfurimonas sp.]